MGEDVQAEISAIEQEIAEKEAQLQASEDSVILAAELKALRGKLQQQKAALEPTEVE